ncbi:MAG: FAD-binding oxidoreductase, partial [Pseudoruegeria sp.]
MDFITELSEILDHNGLLTGKDAVPYGQEWTGKYTCQPLAVARPRNREDVAAIVKLANVHGVSIVPLSGRTGLVGGGAAEGALILSLERMNQIREIRPAARIAVVEPGVILSALHTAAKDHQLTFPMTFGAKDSAMIGGLLSTNAGGSNVLRYGNTRALVLGLEAVLPNGDILDLMNELHKDNSGYDLKDLLIGAEGTLGIITAAVVKLVPQPKAYATAFLGLNDLSDALDLLNTLQSRTSNAVEAYEFMTPYYMALHAKLFPEDRLPFPEQYPVQILVEVGASSDKDATPLADGSLPIVSILEDVLADLLEQGRLSDAMVAQNDGQRASLWAIREHAAELAFHKGPVVDSDISVPVDQVATFMALY